MKIKSLKREVRIKGNAIELTTETKKNQIYAYYLYGPDKKYTKHYTKKPVHSFDVPIIKGRYKATFYYKNTQDNEIYKYSIQFWINKDGSIRNIPESIVAIEDLEVMKKLKLRTIVDKVGFKIDYYDIGASKTFIVFNGAGSLKDTVPFALRYCLNNNYNVIACLQNDNQYQELSFTDFERYIAPLVLDKEVFLYGSSLGGYCAIYYAGAVNGTVISAAPRNSAHPSVTNNISINKKQDFKHSSFSENKKTSKNIYVLYDPHVEVDAFFVKNLIVNQFNVLNLICFEFAGHAVLYHVNKTKQLDQLVKDIVNGNQPKIMYIDSCYTYYGKANYSFKKRSYKESLFLISKALQDNTLPKPLIKYLKKRQYFINEKIGITLD